MFKKLSSMILAIILIVILTIIFIISSFKPNILNTPIFIIPLLLFFLNLTLCTFKRLEKEIKGEIRYAIGPDIIHLGILSLIVGGIVSLYGTREITKVLTVGDTLSYSNYTILIDDYYYLEYEDGRPKDWITTVSIIKKGEPIKTKDIEVGKPLRLQELSLYQISYSPDGTGVMFKVDRSYSLKLISFILIFIGVFVTYINKLKERK